ncbi:MAG: DNA translocase FtsK [Beijerinckiaceae bacterium]|nr:DNA translocase FtsK [Beijerinckiaceae bacterium]
MPLSRAGYSMFDWLPESVRDFIARWARELAGIVLIGSSLVTALALASWNVRDPSLNQAIDGPIKNWLGFPGAATADILMQLFGLATLPMLGSIALIGWRCLSGRALPRLPALAASLSAGIAAASGFASGLPMTDRWPLPTGFGGVAGDAMLALPALVLGGSHLVSSLATLAYGAAALLSLSYASGLRHGDAEHVPDEPVLAPKRVAKRSGKLEHDDEPNAAIISLGAVIHAALTLKSIVKRRLEARRARNAATQMALHAAPAMSAAAARPARARREPTFQDADEHASNEMVEAAPRRNPDRDAEFDQDDAPAQPSAIRIAPPAPAIKPGRRMAREDQGNMFAPGDYELPALSLLAEPKKLPGVTISEDALEQNARLLEGVLEDFGVKGEIINVRPGPVVTLYELEPAPGIKSSRVIGLAEDIARSMSAIAARVAVVPGRNIIGIELPNSKRETVYLREMLASADFESTKFRLPICLGKTIGGEPVIVELARMPHLLIAGTTGSGKSVAVNTMILSLLYRLRPEECRLIMIDPKMLELSVYDGIPHLLTPVVTDPKKAVVALKWAVREMEQRYQKMSKVGVRNIDGFNARVLEAKAKGETITRTVQTGYDRETGEATYENEEIALAPLPFIVVLIDEMADLMLVAGKDIEGLVQRLAQMARAAGIHVIMATQRPSVDVITGTIKANFPTRISFQVTSKIDSRTILSEQGAEQLLGQGDMLYMAGGGRISRVHGPFCSDEEVEKVVAHLKLQAPPSYLDEVTIEDEAPAEEGEDGAVFDKGSFGEEGGDLYDQAVKVVLRDRKCSTSYIQRRLQVGYNKAASLVERMEDEGIVGPANATGKREILMESREAYAEE